MTEKPVVVFLSGIPGSGKSTIIKNKSDNGEWLDFVVLSVDSEIESIAKNQGISATIAHKKHYKKCNKKILKEFTHLLSQNRNVILDRNNATKMQRETFLNLVPNNYHKKAVVIEAPVETAVSRVDARNKLVEKIFIPLGIVYTFAKNFELPSKEEFDETEIIRNY